MELLTGTVLACAVSVFCPAHTCSIDLVVWYMHPSPVDGEVYRYEIKEHRVPAATLAWELNAHPEGAPVGIVWKDHTAGAIVRQCGVNPTEVFRDGFESGDTRAWR